MISRSVQLLLGLVGVAVALPTRDNDIVPGKFIVTLQPDVGHELELHTRWVSEVHANNLRRRRSDSLGVEETFDIPGFHAYAGSFDEATLETIRANSSVLRVEPEKIVHIAAITTQANPPWGLSAISTSPPSPNSAYTYDSSAGEGTFSYILDTGILLEHVEFQGRAVFGTNVHGSGSDRMHGTVVASVAGGVTFGVAKRTTLVDVQVLGSDSGTTTGIIRGLAWTRDDVLAKSRVGKSVVNMSLGGSNSPTLNNAVQTLIDAGIPVVVASGNSFIDASDQSPANQPNVITVGATDRNWRRASFSNYGSVVDVFAPGVGIQVASSTSTTATRLVDGTSEASPHVAGLVAYLLGLEGLRTPAQIKTRVLELATKDLIQDARGSGNFFVYNGIGN
ncbi:oryzin [Stachybotrys elegans]|uniref:Oryzin n=1 Tax=Stachybotrys elegans TaxID=80388 RepID=A0A8K0SG29_9HYPO|nr:oryzin [Stachybotrys elegans]